MGCIGIMEKKLETTIVFRMLKLRSKMWWDPGFRVSELRVSYSLNSLTGGYIGDYRGLL